MRLLLPRTRPTGRLSAEAVMPPPKSVFGQPSRRGLLAAACGCCAAGVFGAAALPPSRALATSRLARRGRCTESSTLPPTRLRRA